MFNYIILFSLIFFSNFCFYLFPWVHIPGVINTTDIGILVIFLAIGVNFIGARSGHIEFMNFGALLVALYLLMILLTVSVASFNYGQSIFDGIVGVRDQLYYLSYFVFLYCFRTLEDVRKLLNFVTVLAFVLVIMSLFSYLTGYTLFYHKWAEGHGIRSGFTRLWIPAMPVIAMALFWNVVKIDNGQLHQKKSILSSLLLFSAFVIRQTRGHLVGVTFAIFGLWFLQRKYRRLLVMSLVVSPIIVIVDMIFFGTMSSLFVSTLEDINDQSGTWAPRAEQIEFAIDQIREHPIFGTGAEALRETSDFGGRGLSAVSYKADLGYLSFIKAYGLVGGIWLIAFFLYTLWNSQKIQGFKADGQLYWWFCKSYMLYVLVSFITINHFMYPSGIVCLMFVLALVTRLKLEYR